jgi:hypothetical protein
MSDAICPKCHEKIEPFALSLAFFPFYFKCNRCNVRLKLKSLKLIASILSAYVLVVVTMIWLLPAFRAYAVLTSVFVWLVLYNFIAHKMLSKDNLLIVE